VVVGEVSNPDIPTVDADNSGGATLAAEHLSSMGRQRIATVTGPMRSGAAATRRVAFERALAAAGRPIAPELVVESDFTEEAAYAATTGCWSHEPDAIFAFSDRMAVGVLRALARKRVARCPGMWRWSGSTTCRRALAGPTPLTTIRQEVEQAGVVAVALLLERISAPGSPPRRVELPTTLVVRGSTQVAADPQEG
jgi:LacI family transcriptional regulator